jgi:hypothetical protein
MLETKAAKARVYDTVYYTENSPSWEAINVVQLNN